MPGTKRLLVAKATGTAGVPKAVVGRRDRGRVAYGCWMQYDATLCSLHLSYINDAWWCHLCFSLRFFDHSLATGFSRWRTVCCCRTREPAHEVRAKRGETGFMSQAAMERVSLGLSGCQAEASTKNCIELVWMLLPKGNNVCELHANFLVFQSQQMRRSF